MFLRVVILFFAATCCTARVIDDKDKHWAWERSGKFQGDIMLTNLQLRNGLVNPLSRWPNGEVPFVIDRVFNTAERNRIALAIFDFHQRTPVRFRLYDPQTDRDYVYITGQNTGCWSYVGRIGGCQELNLQRNGCLWHGIIIHELLHALGFLHEHSATDRDNYVTIHWENIEPGMENNFFKYSARVITNFGVPYDYGSVMHYGPYAFSWNGQRTIDPTDPTAEIGQIDGFSAKDIEKVARMYESSTLPANSTLVEISTLFEASNLNLELTCVKNSSYATRSQLISLIMIILLIFTHLQ